MISWATMIKLVMVLSTVAAMSDGCVNSADRSTSVVVNDQQNTYNQNSPMHTYDRSWERDAVQRIYDARVTDWPQTWYVWSGANGVPVGMCVGRGYGIPYGVDLTAYLKEIGAGGPVDQASPNGLYMQGATTSASWIFCTEKNGEVSIEYRESEVDVYTHPVEIIRDERGVPLALRDLRDTAPGTISFDPSIAPPKPEKTLPATPVTQP